MDETLIPFQVSMGVVVVGSFIDEEDPEGYVDPAFRLRTGA